MASTTKVITEYVDDLDGTRAEGTVTFTVDGKSFEIDLSKKNRALFEKALKPYVESARPVRASRRRGRTSASGRAARAGTGKRGDLQQVREWARANGFEVSDRGRVPSTVLDAYDAK